MNTELKPTSRFGKLDPLVRSVVLRLRVKWEFLPECLQSEVAAPGKEQNKKHRPGHRFLGETSEIAFGSAFLDSLEAAGFNYAGYHATEDEHDKAYVIVFFSFSRDEIKKAKDMIIEDNGFRGLREFCCRSLWGMEAYRNPIGDDKFNIVINIGARVDIFNPDGSYIQRWINKRQPGLGKADIVPQGILSVVNGAITIAP